ncbi:anaphase-promoting complex subunit 8 [Carex littledalei]|uniref:Anaphase-promoting complex subunit 8 n=1 Tax=Carex littledalei TaxID=544730 RepID=A0A833VHC1_9POAL|nr:anaphase-promoting complex subunit 8 [Carex littledalei]
MASKESCRNELRHAVKQLSDRGLHSASKWAAELLVGIEPDTPSSRPRTSGVTPLSSTLRHRFRAIAAAESPATATPPAGVSYVSTPIPSDDTDNDDYDSYLLAKSCFDCREYRRASHALRGQTGKRAVFLRCYALYMAGEKRKEEETIELEGPLGKSDSVNTELATIERELSSLHRNRSIDSFGLYLYGIVLRDKGCGSQALSVLVESVNSYPWNWSAWTELTSLCTTLDMLRTLNLKNHWMKDFFLASAFLELKMHEEALETYKRLLTIFRLSDYIQAQVATVHYNMRELDEAELIFEELLRTDPYRMESMDTYSNILYAKESFSTLSFLAHRVFLTDKYRPESCCIIANYYSLKGQHEKSVLYFRRALKLNRKYLSAWTLMGHEYVEMKNTPAAIDAYRRAIEINPRDYRAWYGLGQMYEMMGMIFYALYYYSKSAALQPNDARLWNAMAHCYESAPLGRIEEAIRCYKRSADCNDAEGIALHELARLYGELGQADQAAVYYKKDLDRMDAEERQGPNYVEAMFFLAKYCKSVGRYDEAEHYATRLLDSTGPEKETAKSILRGLRASNSGFASMEIDHFAP